MLLLNRSEGVLAPVTGYVIPARAGVWRLSWGPLGDSGLSRRRAAPPLASSVGVFRGAFPGTGTTRMGSPDRELQNVR